MQAGIVGLPNVGKSTLFNAMTAAGAESANYPFCTIEPNVGVVPVPDARLARIEDLIPTEKVVPTTVEILDIAGLVRGASKGEGLGNQFLGHIRSVDAVLHVVRCFIDEDIIHVEGSIDPLRDIETIETELLLADLELLERRAHSLRKQARGGDKDAHGRADLMERALALAAQGQSLRLGDWTDDDLRIFREYGLITARPMLFVCNVDEASARSGNEMTATVADYVQSHRAGMVVLCAQIEAEVAELDPEEQVEFLSDLGLTEPGLHKLARATYELLGMLTFFTAGPKEIRAWTIRRGTKAPQAAGVIHTDFERGFIRAEVYTLPVLQVAKTEAALKATGKLRVEGKEYVVQDGDIMHFRFNV